MEATDDLPDFAKTQVKEIDLTIVNTLNLTMVKSPEDGREIVYLRSGSE